MSEQELSGSSDGACGAAGVDRNGRAAGITMAASCIIMVGFTALHPKIHAHGIESFIEAVAAEAVRNVIVHGVLIGAIAVLLAGMTVFVDRIGRGSMCARIGLVGYVMGAASGMAAAAINGLAVPALAMHYRELDANALDGFNHLMRLCHAMNGAFMYLMIMAMSIAVVLWSVLLMRREAGGRGIGILGIVLGGLPAILVVAGRLPHDLHGFGGFVLAQCVWSGLVAVKMIRGRI